MANSSEAYWCFICNPAKWAIDDALADGISMDRWGVRPADASRIKPGQLGIIRVGLDRRSKAKLGGKPRLKSGIYAIVEVLSKAVEQPGSDSKYWHEESRPKPGRKSVEIRYLRSYLDRPLPIDTLKSVAGIDNKLIDGFQARSQPISRNDFQSIIEMLGETEASLAVDTLVGLVTIDQLPLFEDKYLFSAPEVRTRVSKRIERGPVGNLVKTRLGFKCRLCQALGLSALGFATSSGGHYVEAHHVMPVCKQEVGSLHHSNIMVLCANHHRQMHYGVASVAITAGAFNVMIDGNRLSIPKTSLLD